LKSVVDYDTSQLAPLGGGGGAFTIATSGAR
jgi:hypothetical protein